VRLAEDEPEGLRVEDLDVLNPPIGMRVPTLELGVDDAAEGGRHVLRIERATVTEPKAPLKANFVLGRAQRHDRFGEIGDDLERSRVDGDEGGEQKS